MTEIERRIEAPGRGEPDYAGTTMSEKDVGRERHRRFVGGLWEDMGKLQLDFLIQQGLKPDDRFLDIGCGSLRAGVHLVDYLTSGHYYGIDVNHDLIRVGYDHELSDDQRERLPSKNLRSTDRFNADFGVQFDMAIAQSVFTHVSLNQMRLCLYRAAKVMRPGGRLFATFFERAPHYPLDGVRGRSYSERNVYWYYRADLRWVARFSPWEFRYIGDWGHPRGQAMVQYTRLTD